MERVGKKSFYGWHLVAVCFAVNFIIFGISVNTFTVYVKPIEAELGWSRGEISLAITLAALALGMTAPLIGRLIDWVGARLVMAVGVGVVGVGLILLSRIQSLPGFYLVYAVSGVGQGAATMIPVSLIITNWFSQKRGKALGVALTAECAGLRYFGAVFGVLTLSRTTGVAAGAVLSGVVYDTLKTYVPAFVLYIALAVISGICGMMARKSRPFHVTS